MGSDSNTATLKLINIIHKLKQASCLGTVSIGNEIFGVRKYLNIWGQSKINPLSWIRQCCRAKK